MDPLSLSANIIAVVQAASAVSRGLQKLYNLQHAPEELSQFINEISDIQVVFTTLAKITSDLDHPSTKLTKELLQKMLQQATEILDEFDLIFRENGIVQTVPVLKFSRTAWLKNLSRLRTLSISLRNVRQNLNNTLILATTSEMPRLRIHLSEVSLQSQEAGVELRRFQDSTQEQIVSLSLSLAKLGSIVKEVHSLGMSARSPHAPDPTTSSAIRVQTSLFTEGSCRMACMCRCHKITTRTVPRWLETLVGSLFVGYSGIPYRSACNERNCLPDKSCLLKVDYYFPHWFLRRCMVSFRDRWNPTEGHSLSVRTPRVLPSANEPVFLMAERGNIAGLKGLFSQQLASPFDVAPGSGNTLLHLAISYYQIETCEFLIKQCADPTAVSMNLQSPIDLAWGVILRAPESAMGKAAKDVFGISPEFYESVHKRNFTILHRIVLQLSPLDLTAQLQTSTAEIDTGCSLGRTPLYWAASLSNTQAMETLLRFGASIDRSDVRGLTPLHAIAFNGTLKALKILLAAAVSMQPHHAKTAETSGRPVGGTSSFETSSLRQTSPYLRRIVDAQDAQGETPLSFLCRPTPNNPNAFEFARILIDHSADVNVGYHVGIVAGTPLMLAIQKNKHAITRLLLRNGARVDVKDGENQGVLHVAAICGDLEMINILRREERIGSVKIELDIYNHTPLQAFDIVRPQFTNEDEISYSSCREAFLLLLQHCDNRQEVPIFHGNRIEEVFSGTLEDEEADVFYDFEQVSGDIS